MHQDYELNSLSVQVTQTEGCTKIMNLTASVLQMTQTVQVTQTEGCTKIMNLTA